jgi:hypothetical protein
MIFLSNGEPRFPGHAEHAFAASAPLGSRFVCHAAILQFKEPRFLRRRQRRKQSRGTRARAPKAGPRAPDISSTCYLWLLVIFLLCFSLQMESIQCNGEGRASQGDRSKVRFPKLTTVHSTPQCRTADGQRGSVGACQPGWLASAIC